MMRKMIGVLSVLAINAACSHHVQKVHTDPKTGTTTTTTTTIGVPCASVYYYEPATVYYVATYCSWPRSRVEYYFSIGWSCDDLIIGFEFSRRCHRPWSEVVHYYDQAVYDYRQTNHVTNVYNNTTINVDQSQHVWNQVNNNVNVTQNNTVIDNSMNQMVQNNTVFAEGTQDLQAQAIADVYKVEPAQAEAMLEKGYDVGELAKACEESGQDGKIEVAELESELKENHAEFEKLEDKVEAGDTADLKEAVTDSPDWKPEDEQKLADRPVESKKEMVIEIDEPEKKEAPRFEPEQMEEPTVEQPKEEPPVEPPSQEEPKSEEPPQIEEPKDKEKTETPEEP